MRHRNSTMSKLLRRFGLASVTMGPLPLPFLYGEGVMSPDERGVTHPTHGVRPRTLSLLVMILEESPVQTEPIARYPCTTGDRDIGYRQYLIPVQQ